MLCYLFHSVVRAGRSVPADSMSHQDSIRWREVCQGVVRVARSVRLGNVEVRCEDLWQRQPIRETSQASWRWHVLLWRVLSWWHEGNHHSQRHRYTATIHLSLCVGLLLSSRIGYVCWSRWNLFHFIRQCCVFYEFSISQMIKASDFVITFTFPFVINAFVCFSFVC